MERKKGNKTYYRGRTILLNQKYRKSLETLEVRREGFATAIERLRSRARSFGMLPAEISDAIVRITGHLMHHATQPPPRTVSLQRLDAWLTGHPNPIVLTTRKVRQTMRQSLAAARSLLSQGTGFVRREVLNEIRQSSTAALIHLFGAGGCGKSIAGLMTLEELADQHVKPPPFLAVNFAETTNSEWVGSCLCTWRNWTEAAVRGEECDDIIKRLATAVDTDDSPILVLLHDALDEMAPQQDRTGVLKIVEYFATEHERCEREGEIPLAQLIITTRTTREVNNGWLSRSGFGAGPGRCKPIQVSELTDAEFDSIPDNVLPPSATKRIRETAQSRLVKSPSLNASPLAAAEITSFASATINDSVYDALKHPVMLGCLARMDETQINAVFDADPSAIKILSNRCIDWFCSKTFQRKYRIPETSTKMVLRSVARHRGSTTNYGSDQADWLTPCNGMGNNILVHNVMEEAEASGLIIRDNSPTEWRWRNQFICVSLL